MKPFELSGSAGHPTPRLIKLLGFAALLGPSEAEYMIRDWRDGYRTGGCEAVVHFGGPVRVLKRALKLRSTYRDLYQLEDTDVK